MKNEKIDTPFAPETTESVCPKWPGDLPTPERNEIVAMIESAPQMLELLKSIATPRRGSEEESWTIYDMAHRASEILSQIEKTKSLLP